MAPDLNSLATAASSSVTSSGHQQAQNNHHLSTSLQPQPTTSSSRNSTSRSASNRSSPNHSRRTSQLSPMNPPPLPLGHHSNASSTAHTHQQSQQTYAPFPPLSPNMSSMSGAALNGRARTGSGAGAETDAGVPMRHPRPLTAAELHHELELEQEAVVNRLTRELSALRAHSASVASTTSVSSMSTSNSLQGSHAHLHPPASAGTPFPLFEATGDPLSTGAAHHAGALTGPTHPSGTASRRSRDRSSSSVSRSGTSAGPPTLSHSVGGGAGPVAGAGLVGVHTGGQQQHHRYSISSPGGGSSSTSNSNNATGAPTSAATTGSTPAFDSSSASSSTYAGGVALARSPSLGVSAGGSVGGGHVSRFEETALHRQELEEAKRENELLRKRIRELEAELRGRRRASTAASANGTAAAAAAAAAGENGGSGAQETVSHQSGPEAAAVASAEAS